MHACIHMCALCVEARQNTFLRPGHCIALGQPGTYYDDQTILKFRDPNVLPLPLIAAG